MIVCSRISHVHKPVVKSEEDGAVVVNRDPATVQSPSLSSSPPTHLSSFVNRGTNTDDDDAEEENQGQPRKRKHEEVDTDNDDDETLYKKKKQVGFMMLDLFRQKWSIDQDFKISTRPMVYFYSEMYEKHPEDFENNIDFLMFMGHCYSNACEHPTKYDITNALKWYNKAASKKHADAYYQIGMCHLFYKKYFTDYFTHVRKNMEQAIKLDPNHVHARWRLGYICTLEEGHISKEDFLTWGYIIAIKMFTWLYENYPDYQPYWGIKPYCSLAGVYRSVGKCSDAIDLYLKHNRNQHLYDLGHIYRYERKPIDETNHMKAFEYFKENYDGVGIKGIELYYELAYYYRYMPNIHKLSLEESWSKAFNLYSKGADGKDKRCYIEIASMYRTGWGVVKCIKSSIEWYKKAAKHGSQEAFHILGEIYYYGEKGVVNISPEMAIEYLNKAGLTKSWFLLGQIYKSRNASIKAYNYYRKAAHAGHSMAMNKLAYLLKQRFIRTAGTPEEQKKEMVEMFYKSACKNIPSSCYEYARICYEKGLSIANEQQKKEKWEEAVKWYRKLAEQGYAQGQCNLGFMYDNGKGVPQNHEEAVKWYRKAAEQGYAHAQRKLESMCNNSRGHSVP